MAPLCAPSSVKCFCLLDTVGGGEGAGACLPRSGATWAAPVQCLGPRAARSPSLGCWPEVLDQTAYTAWVGGLCLPPQECLGTASRLALPGLTWPHLPTSLHVSYQRQAGQPHAGVFGVLAACCSSCHSGREGV